MQLRDFLGWARETGALVEIKRAVDPRLELARVVRALDGQPVIFQTLAGFPGWHTASGVCAQRRHFAAALGCTVPDLTSRMAGALAHPTPPPLVDHGPCQEVPEVRVDLTRLPIPHYHPGDGGRYVTAGVAIVKDPNLGRNMSFHRLMVLDGTRFTARVVEGTLRHDRERHGAHDRGGVGGAVDRHRRKREDLARAERQAECQGRHVKSIFVLLFSDSHVKANVMNHLAVSTRNFAE